MSKVYRPSMPFQTGIPGGIYDGKIIEIKGRISYGASRFQINLIDGFDLSSDRPLHLGIRFDQNCVVRNHLDNGHWGPEERHPPFPFAAGREFTMTIVAERSKYRISVNNQHCWDFKHRLSMQRVKSFAMEGTVDVHEVDFIEKTNHYPAYPSTPAVSSTSYATPGHYVYVTPGRPSLEPVYNPRIPFAYPIYGGLQPGMAIYISGRPTSSPHSFTINLQKGAVHYPPPDVAFHFSPRFFNRSVVRNTRSSCGAWAHEETLISHFPFHPGASFDLVIRVEVERYSVSINGQHFIDFRHRLRPLQMFDTLFIENDVSISSIHFA